jgi:hypothetical protein
MRQIFVLILVLIYISGCYKGAQAAIPMEVHVSVGKVSEVAFSEKIAKVIKGGAPDSILVEVLDNSVYLLPKTNTPADVFITGVSGESYPLKLRISAEHDVRVQVKGSSVHRLSHDVKTDAMDLIKDILRGQEPAGATVLKGGQFMSLSEGQIKMSVETIYDFPHMAAYIFKAHNLMDNSVIIPIEQMSFPNLLAVSSDQDMLKPKGQEGDTSKVYIIAGK